jgi:hypothetical protein
MTTETMAREIEDLKEAYGEISTAPGSPGQTLLRITKAGLPAGCKPADTTALLILQDRQRPILHIKPGIHLANGAVPRSTSSVEVGGEEWLQFSYTFPYDQNTHTLVQFVEASLRRFAKTE